MFIFLVWASQLLALFCVLLLLSWLEEDNELTCWLENNLTACKHYTVTLCKSTWMVTLVTEVGSTGEDLGGGCRGCTPLPPEMTCSFLTQLVFCIKIGSYHQSVTPFLRGVPSTKRNPRSAPEAGGNNVQTLYKCEYLTIIPLAQIGSESIAHEDEGRMCYWLRGHEGERNNCFSKIHLVGQRYRE